MKKKKIIKIKWGNIAILLNTIICIIIYFSLNDNINANIIKLSTILLLAISMIAIESIK